MKIFFLLILLVLLALDIILFLMPFRRMKRLKAEIDRFEAAHRQEKQAELIRESGYLALQNQINPHFLYNTLDAIRSDAMKAGAMEVADLIEALSSFFAYTISNMDQYATVHEELEHVREYYYIQKYRFQDRLHLKIDNSEAIDLKALYVPRLLLQPLVENAISHGLENQQHQGTVSISFQETGTDLVIHVSDNGVGMDHETLGKLNERLAQDKLPDDTRDKKRRGGIALVNVNRRIHMLFGDDYGLHIYSISGAGTDAVVRIPKFDGEAAHEN